MKKNNYSQIMNFNRKKRRAAEHRSPATGSGSTDGTSRADSSVASNKRSGSEGRTGSYGTSGRKSYSAPKTRKTPEASSVKKDGNSPHPFFRQNPSDKNPSGRQNPSGKQKHPGNTRDNTKKDMTDRCPLARKCGGCVYQGVPYEKQLTIKHKEVRNLLNPYVKVPPVTGMEHPYHYRNKVHAVFARTPDGKIKSGIFQEGTHKVVNVDSCLIEDEIADRIIVDIRSLLKSFKIKIYDEDTRYGLLRHVLIRRGFASGQVMVVLVLASPILPSKNNFVKALRRLHPEITTIIINVNEKRTNMVLGERNITLYGKGYIEDDLCGCRFRISPSSFYQINPVQTEILYRTAMEYAGLSGSETVIDAYCGIGTIGLIAAKHAGTVIGVELNQSAVKDAIINARLNNIKNIYFYNQDASSFITARAEYNEGADVLFMDPPRSGSTEEFLQAAASLGPERIVYISCNPETLARDLQYLVTHGYEGTKCRVIDMFPFSGHIECVVLLTRTKKRIRKGGA